MDEIVKQLIHLNQKDWLDMLAAFIPILLSVIIIVQNIIYYRGNKNLQKQIHNRDQRVQYHQDIMLIYNTFYEFCDGIIRTGFANHVKMGNVNLSVSWLDHLIQLRMNLGRRGDLAKLLFEKGNTELYQIIKDRADLGIKIIDLYLDYINSGNLFHVSENAWNTIILANPGLKKYDYKMLMQNPQILSSFTKLCYDEKIPEIETLYKQYTDMHVYEKYDRYFEKYFTLNEL